MTDAQAFFSGSPKLTEKLYLLSSIGLGYLRLGQAATTLSGGEAQRLKIAAELKDPSAHNLLYILDEPTTGLHLDDIKKLLAVLHKLVDAGNTLIVVEHNLDVIKTADWVIDLGPEGGEAGGHIIAEGRPEQVAKIAQSHTGQFLAKVLAEARGSRHTCTVSRPMPWCNSSIVKVVRDTTTLGCDYLQLGSPLIPSGSLRNRRTAKRDGRVEP